MDTCWERGTPFSPIECPWVYQPHSREGPCSGAVGQHSMAFMSVLFVCYFLSCFLFYFISFDFCCLLFFVCLFGKGENIMRLGGEGEGKEYDQNELIFKDDIWWKQVAGSRQSRIWENLNTKKCSIVSTKWNTLSISAKVFTISGLSFHYYYIYSDVCVQTYASIIVHAHMWKLEQLAKVVSLFIPCGSEEPNTWGLEVSSFTCWGILLAQIFIQITFLVQNQITHKSLRFPRIFQDFSSLDSLV